MEWRREFEDSSLFSRSTTTSGNDKENPPLISLVSLSPSEMIFELDEETSWILVILKRDDFLHHHTIQYNSIRRTSRRLSTIRVRWTAGRTLLEHLHANQEGGGWKLLPIHSRFASFPQIRLNRREIARNCEVAFPAKMREAAQKGKCRIFPKWSC